MGVTQRFERPPPSLTAMVMKKRNRNLLKHVTEIKPTSASESLSVYRDGESCMKNSCKDKSYIVKITIYIEE